MKRHIDEIIKKIERYKSMSINEAQTRDWLVKPFFEALGWDCGSEDFSPEDANINGQRPDYKCKYNREDKFLLEIKRLGHRLDEKTIRGKVNDYIGDSKIPILIITDGERYQMYYSQLEGYAESRLFKEIVLSPELNINDLDILRYQKFQNGNPLRVYAQNIHNNQLVEDALRSLCDKPTVPFINCLKKKINPKIGHDFPEDKIKEILQEVKIGVDVDKKDNVITHTYKGNPAYQYQRAYSSPRKLPPFTFSEAGIEIGSQLTFKNDRNITAEVFTSKNGVLFEGNKHSVSGAADIVLKRMGYNGRHAGTHYWEYEGETLTERRLRIIGERNEGEA